MAARKELIINRDWCKGCGICAAFCPKQVLELVDEKVEKVHEDQCVFCGQCEMRCPDYAVYIEEVEEEEINQWVKSY